MRNVPNKICAEHLNTHFMFRNVIFRKSCRLWDNVERARPQMIIKYYAEKIRFACRITKLRIQTHNHNMQYILLFHGNNGFTNALQCYFMRLAHFLRAIRQLSKPDWLSR